MFSRPWPENIAFDEQLKADIRSDIDRIFAEAFPTIFKSAA